MLSHKIPPVIVEGGPFLSPSGKINARLHGQEMQKQLSAQGVGIQRMWI